MFRKLAQFLETVTSGELTPADRVFTFHPEQLSRWLDEIGPRAESLSGTGS